MYIFWLSLTGVCEDGVDVIKYMDNKRGFSISCPLDDALIDIPLRQCLEKACADRRNIVEFYNNVCRMRTCPEERLSQSHNPSAELLSTALGGWNIYIIHSKI